MRRNRKKWCLGCSLMWVLALSAYAQDMPLTFQTPLNTTPPAQSTPSSAIGEARADLLPGNGTRGPYSLRYAPIIPNSEVVYVDGKRLQREVDYWIDYGSGTLAFTMPVHRFSTVQVHYRYDPNAPRVQATGSLPLLALSFGQSGSLQALYMPGVSETTQNGASYQLSAYGLRNQLNFAGGGLQGYYFLGSRTPLQAFASPIERDPKRATPDSAETTRFIVQNLALDAGAVQIRGYYQDIGKGFSAQKMLGTQSGVDAQQLAQWERQQGLKRYDYTLGLKLGQGASLQQEVLRIQDESATIEQEGWRFQSARLNFDWNRREASPQFQRFQDLAHPQAGDWQRERGIVREQASATLNLSANSTLQWSQTELTHGQGRIEREQYALNLSGVKLQHFQQSVSEGFGRFGDIAEQNRGQLAREVGMSREKTQLEVAQKAFTLNAGEETIRSPTGAMEREHLQLITPFVEIQRIWRLVSPQFGRLANLTPEEHQQMVEEVHQFHDPQNTVPLKPNEDIPQVLRESGIERNLQRVELKPTKDLSLQLRRYELANRAGEGDIRGEQWQIRTPTLQLRLHERGISSAFNRFGDLTRIERMMFHNEQGMKRSDWDASFITPQFGFAIAQMRVHAIGAGVQRTSYRLMTPKLEVHYNERQVDNDFARAHDLADPERDFFAQLRGFRQHDWTARLKPAPNFQLELFQFDAKNPLEQIGNRRNRYRLLWQPFRNLTYGRQQDDYRSDKTAQSLYQDDYERNDLQYQFGWGQLNAYNERRQIGGTLANPLYQTTDFWKFGSNAVRNLNFSLEERRTRAQGAPSEVFRYQSFGYTPNPNLKLNFAYAQAHRDGAPDETSQQLGLEYQLRQGTKLQFSETRTGKENANGTRVLSAGLTQTAFGVLSVGANYQEWRTDRVNTKAQSQVLVQSARPFDFLMLKGLQFEFRYGALADQRLWQQENKHFTGQATLFGRKVSGGYVGLYVPGQGRAVDRYYQLESAPEERLRYNLLYKVRTYQDGRLFLVRNYKLSYQLDQRFTVSHEFQTHPEQANPHVVLGSVLQPTGFSNWGLEWRWTPQVRLRGDYRIEWNDQQNRRIRRGGLTLIGEQTDRLRYDVGYRYDSERLSNRYGIAHTFFLSTERKIDSEHYLMFGIQWTHYERRPEPSVPRDQQRLVLELRRPF